MAEDEGPLGPNLRVAIQDARVAERDDRGLMPIDTARAWLAGRSAFVKGDGSMVDGRYVLESDRTWAALVSLQDAEEFVRQAGRLRWRFHVRGRDNLALWERYGDGILPWISDRVDDNGVLHNVPWCVLPCLLASGGRAAFEIAARVRAVTEQVDAGSWIPDTDGVGVLCQWVVRHPDPGYRLLGERAAAGDDRAAGAIRALHGVDPRGTRQRFVSALGQDGVSRLYGRVDLAVPPLPDAVRAVLESAPVVHLAASQPLAMAELDERFGNGAGPAWDNANVFCAAMRMTGFVNPGGTDGLVFQSLVTGLGSDDISIEFHRFGFAMVPESGWWREILDGDTAAQLAETLGEVTVQMPNGEVRARLGRHLEFGESVSELETLMLTLTAGRAARDRVFLTGDQIKHALTLPATAQPLFVLDSWDHPPAGATASDAVDLVLALEALRSRRAIAASTTEKSRDAHVGERLSILG